jgi:hypothetical protein
MASSSSFVCASRRQRLLSVLSPSRHHCHSSVHLIISGCCRHRCSSLHIVISGCCREGAGTHWVGTTTMRWHHRHHLSAHLIVSGCCWHHHHLVIIIVCLCTLLLAVAIGVVAILALLPSRHCCRSSAHLVISGCCQRRCHLVVVVVVCLCTLSSAAAVGVIAILSSSLFICASRCQRLLSGGGRNLLGWGNDDDEMVLSSSVHLVVSGCYQEGAGTHQVRVMTMTRCGRRHHLLSPSCGSGLRC